MQVNPDNPDAKKINGFEWVVIDGFSIRQGRIGQGGAGHGRAGHGRAMQCGAGHGRAG